MKETKIIGLVLASQLLLMNQAYAEVPANNVPEMDGSGAVFAIGLVAGLAALVREKFFQK